MKWLAHGWLLLVAVLILMAIKHGPVFDSSIMGLLPESDKEPNVQLATNQMAEGFSKRVILLLSSDNEGEVQAAVRAMAVVLEKLPDIANVEWQVQDKDIVQRQQELYPYRFSILDPAVRKQLLNNEFEQVQKRALTNLYSPLNVGRNSIIDDPFGFFSELNLNRKNDFKVQVSNSLLKVTESVRPTYMMMFTLAGKVSSPSLQNRILSKIKTEENTLNQRGITLTMSGMLLHSAAGAEQANKEITTIGLGSLLGITIMMLFVFRHFKPLLLMISAVTIGCLSALAVTTLVFERVHLITLAFGMGLVGVSIDYALHFLCQRSVSSVSVTIDKIILGLALGLFSSVMAYAAQALAPFPGLQQMAVFSVVGLCTSWLTVILCFPFWTRNYAQQTLSVAIKLDRFRQVFPRLENRPVVIGLGLLICILFSVNTLLSSNYADDVRLLQSSPESLLEQDKTVQQQIIASGSSQFLLIQADDIERCLQKEEQLSSILEQLVFDKLIGGYQSVSSFLPSLQRQNENIRLVEKLYEQQLESYYTSISLSPQNVIEAQKIMDQATMQSLSSQVWLSQEASNEGKDLIVRQVEHGAATLIRFTGTIDEEAVRTLQKLSIEDDAVVYIDRVQNISKVIGVYRSEVINLIILAYLGVILVLFSRYKMQVWRVITPPILATAFTLTAIVYLGYGINIFHLMALILVLGIGLDMGIFLHESHEAPHTWLAVSLSAYTSLLAFGLLVLSDTPVLHHFGLTVLLGLSFTWFLVPVMRRNKYGNVY